MSIKLKKIEEITLDKLEEKIYLMAKNLDRQIEKNINLESGVLQLKKELDLMTTKMADMGR